MSQMLDQTERQTDRQEGTCPQGRETIASLQVNWVIAGREWWCKWREGCVEEAGTGSVLGDRMEPQR